MEALSFVVLILLSLVAYSAGSVSWMGDKTEIKPRIVDLILVVIIWGGGIYLKLTTGMNKWLLILLWIAVGYAVGLLATMHLKLHADREAGQKKQEKTSKNPIRNLWQFWKSFSKKMGNFQSKIILSFFFFILVSPFALAVKIFSDPLRIKSHGMKSHWLSKKDMNSDIERFRRQF